MGMILFGIYIVLSIVLTVIGVFIGNIIFFDSILQHTGIGFWTTGGMMSLLWSAAFGVLAYFISEHDPIWGWVVFGLAAVIMGSLHFKARNS